ncbi:MAG TPA: dTDP-4-dehydrorhamnose reductase [Candidatus Sulfotelmatobacter sp.]|nr:dTDP-4-dehydrorhamnose reductase [Candidatus Sulfotelmatobacter sp.]
MTPVLVFGAGGQIGRELIDQRWPDGLRVVGADRASADIADRAAVGHAFARMRPGLVVNAAAYTAVDKAEQESARAFAVNRDGAAHLAEACAAQSVPLIHLSTDYVFDGAKPGPYVEDDPVAPLGVYGASKEAGEAAIRTRCARHVILRTAWVFGAHGNNFVKTMLRLGAERPALGIVADQRGCPTEAADIARTIARIAGALLAPPGAPNDPALLGTFHYVGAPATTWHGFAEAIFRRLAARGRKVPTLSAITTADYPTPARRPANSVLATDKLARVYGIAPCDWPAALDRVLDALIDAPRAAAGTGPER